MSASKEDEQLQAIAIRYDQKKDQAPKVVAKGAGFVADNILAVAKKNAVPVYQNKTLTGMLMAVELDSVIPPDLYRAVAEILAYIYRLDQGKRKH